MGFPSRRPPDHAAAVGSGRAGILRTGAALVVAVALIGVTPPLASAANVPQGQLRPGTAGPAPAASGSSVVETARALVAAQTAVATAHKEVDDSRTLVGTTQAQAADATDAAAAAAVAAEQARRHMVATKRVARKATAAQEIAVARAGEAEGDVKRLAREVYISSGGATELAMLVGFADDGPSALNAFARRDMALNVSGGVTLSRAQRTAKRAAELTAIADRARSDYDGAAQQHRDAAADATQAKRDRRAAVTAFRQAEDRLSRAKRSVQRAEARTVAAQDAYEAASAAGGSGGPPISAGNQGPLVWGMLRAEGFSEEATAGILGNLQQESNIDPTAVQSGGPGRGMAQWSQGGRWDNGSNSLLAFAKSNHLKPLDTATQVQFMIYEMESVLTGFDLEGFKSETDILAATVYFHDRFEASADSAAFVVAVRGGYAKQWYDALHGA